MDSRSYLAEAFWFSPGGAEPDIYHLQIYWGCSSCSKTARFQDWQSGTRYWETLFYAKRIPKGLLPFSQRNGDCSPQSQQAVMAYLASREVLWCFQFVLLVQDINVMCCERKFNKEVDAKKRWLLQGIILGNLLPGPLNFFIWNLLKYG